MLVLTPPSLKEIEWELERERCLRSLSCFVKRFWGVVEPGVKLSWGWHLEAICSHLQAVDEGKFHRLIICIPPGFGKSTLISVLWPAWTWLHKPWIRSLFGSYDESLTFRDSIKCRDVIKSKLYQRLFRPEWQLRKDVDSKSYFANTMQGSRKTYYITSSHKTGWRGNYAVIDDSLSAENRFNAAVKESVFDSWENVISTRVNRSQHHAYVIIMQRLAYDDLVGRLIDKYGDRYVQLILSNEYEPEYHCKTPIFSDPRTIPGELLAPDFFPAERTEESKFSLRDEYVGQFLQRPMPLGGLKFESQYFQHWRWSPHNKVIELMHRDGRLEHINLNKCEQFISIDLAVGTKKKNDSTSMGRWALTHDCNLILLERIKIQAKEGEVVDAAKNFYNDKKWGTNSPSSVAVEDNGLGLPVAQHMAAEGLPVNYINVHQDKETMASSASIRLRGGQIFFPEYCVPWMHEFSLELTRFPGAAHDDDVSMVSIASNSVFEMKHGIKGAAQSFPNNIPRYNINKQASLPARRDLFGTNGH